MAAIVTTESRRPMPITGSPARWSADIAWVGATTGLAAPLVAGGWTPSFLAASAGLGLLTGALLGLLMPDFLDSARRRISLTALGVRCLVVGAGAGAFVGLVAAQVTGAPFLRPLVLAGLAGAVQLGWLWLPYTVLTVLRRPTWPVVAAACTLSPVVGWSALHLGYLLLEALF